MQFAHNLPAERMSVILACFLFTALTGCASYLQTLATQGDKNDDNKQSA